MPKSSKCHFEAGVFQLLFCVSRKIAPLPWGILPPSVWKLKMPLFMSTHARVFQPLFWRLSLKVETTQSASHLPHTPLKSTSTSKFFSLNLVCCLVYSGHNRSTRLSRWHYQELSWDCKGGLWVSQMQHLHILIPRILPCSEKLFRGLFLFIFQTRVQAWVKRAVS